MDNRADGYENLTDDEAALADTHMTSETQSKPRMFFEFYIDDQGKPHFWTHVASDVSFPEMEDALITLKSMIEYQIDNKIKCPLHKTNQQRA